MNNEASFKCPKCSDAINDSRNACGCGYLVAEYDNGVVRIKFSGAEEPVIISE